MSAARTTNHAENSSLRARSGDASTLLPSALMPPTKANRMAPTIVIHPNARGRIFVSAHIFPIVHHHTVRTMSEAGVGSGRSEEHTSELQSQSNLVCRLPLGKKKKGRTIENDHVHWRHISRRTPDNYQLTQPTVMFDSHDTTLQPRSQDRRHIPRYQTAFLPC